MIDRPHTRRLRDDLAPRAFLIGWHESGRLYPPSGGAPDQTNGRTISAHSAVAGAHSTYPLQVHARPLVLAALLSLVASATASAQAPLYVASTPQKGALYRDGSTERYLLGGQWLYRDDRADAGLTAGFWHDAAATDDYYRKALAIRAALAAKYTADGGVQAALASDRCGYGDARLRLGQGKEALGLYREALPTRQAGA